MFKMAMFLTFHIEIVLKVSWPDSTFTHLTHQQHHRDASMVLNNLASHQLPSSRYKLKVGLVWSNEGKSEWFENHTRFTTNNSITARTVQRFIYYTFANNTFK